MAHNRTKKLYTGPKITFEVIDLIFIVIIIILYRFEHGSFDINLVGVFGLRGKLISFSNKTYRTESYKGLQLAQNHLQFLHYINVSTKGTEY